MNEKELAQSFADRYNEAKNEPELNNDNCKFYASTIPHFFEKYPNIDFEILKQELSNLGLVIKPANEINSKRKKSLQKEWDKYKSVFIFSEENESNL